MTRTLPGMFCLFLLAALAGTAALAQPPPPASVTVTYNGAVLPTTPPPVEVESHLLIAMHDIFDAMGAALDWNAATQTVTATRGGTVVQLTIGSVVATVDGKPVHLDVAPRTIADRTMVPLRFVAEATGATVLWNPATRTVAVTSGGLAVGAGTGAPPPAPEVTSPNEGERVGPAVDVKGRSQAGALVRVVTWVYDKETGEKLSEVPGLKTNVWADGGFDVHVALPSGKLFPPEKLSYEIHVTSIVAGQESEPTIVRVSRKAAD